MSAVFFRFAVVISYVLLCCSLLLLSMGWVNSTNRFRKRGLAVVPTLYGINFGAAFLNQARTVVMIYTGMCGVCGTAVSQDFFLSRLLCIGVYS